jgi:glucose/arabinose dehydrogenase
MIGENNFKGLKIVAQRLPQFSPVNKIILAVLAAALLTSCYRMRTSKGGGQIESVSTGRNVQPADIQLAPGYKITLVAQGFTFPSALALDDVGNLYAIETGYAYGEVWREPRLVQIKADGAHVTIATGTKNGPWTGLAFHDGNFYVSEGGEAEGGKILRISKHGDITTLADNLPSVGDHHTNMLVIKDDYIYFGQGTATNSAIVGPDNLEFGWMKRKPDFHDIPCGDLVLTGQNYESENILTEDPNDKTSTGAFSPFGTPTTEGQVIKGSVPCTGAILRVPLTGGKVEMVAWGLRNPYGIALSSDGTLYATENAYDDRGSRPVWGAGDVLWKVEQNTWYGWPDFSEGKRIQDDEEFKAPSKREVRPLVKTLPNDPPKPVAVLGVHSSSSGLDFSKSDAFGFVGQAFIAQFGDMAPKVGKVLEPVGFKIVRVDVNTGVIRDFAVNKGKRNGPASWLKTGGLERPLSVKFDSSGKALYVVDFGILKMTEKGPYPQEKTGVIWKITKD